MDELMKSAVRITLVCLILSLAVWVIAEPWRPVAAGFGAGSIISLLNANLLRNRVQNIPGDSSTSKRRTRVRLGFGMRTALVLLGALFALRFPHMLNLPSILAGSFIVQLTMLPVAFWHTRRGRG